MKRLIVNADDFGYTRSTNLGIIETFQRGIVTSATIMASGRAFAHAVECAKENPNLGIGCHLVLIGGSCVAPAEEIPSLADRAGNLPASWPVLLKKLLAGAINSDEMARELRAQISQVLGSGIEVTHLDTHKHTHAHPLVMEQVARVAEEFSICRVRRPFENVSSLMDSALRDGTAYWPQSTLGILAHTAAPSFDRIVHSRRLLTPDQFWGVGATGNLNATAILSMISSMSEGVNELMCHPGQYDAELELSATRLKHERERELNALLDPSVRKALSEHQIELTSFRGLN